MRSPRRSKVRYQGQGPLGRWSKLIRYGGCCLKVLVDRRAAARWSTVWGYLKLHWLTRVQPHRTTPVRLVGYDVAFGSLRSLRQVYREVFIERTYARFAPAHASLILDVGANIGIAMLWYLRHYPEAQIVCFEPNPLTYELLDVNVRANDLDSVSTHRLALAAEEGTKRFYFDASAPAGELTYSVSQTFRSSAGDRPDIESEVLPVAALKPYLTDPVDILKIDIEGSEAAVLSACVKELERVRVLQLEYHQLPENPLAGLLDLLERAGHSYQIDGAGVDGGSGVAMVYSRNRRPATA